MVTIAYSGTSKPSAVKIADEDEHVQLVRSSNIPVDVNWGRAKADALLNPDISNVTNKRVMRQLFQEHGVPMPHLLTHHEAHSAALEGKQLIGRPDRHSKGRGLWRVNDNTSFMKAWCGTRKKKAATHFMEYVESDREYRVHVFKGKSIRISEKVFKEDGSYTTRKPGDIKLRKVREAAKLAVDAVGLDFGAVDILARGDANQDVWVLEVNAAPGCGGSVPRLYAETFRRWKEEL
jgi:glutathione synthase/RimK-type ligase-like ATP-grasp enzyme